MDRCAVDDWFEYVAKSFHNFGHLDTKILKVALLAQTFYCYRTAVLTRSKYAVALIAAVGNNYYGHYKSPDIITAWYCSNRLSDWSGCTRQSC